MRLILSCLIAGCLTSAASSAPPDDGWSADIQAVADGNNRFAIDLYGKLQAGSGNLFFSPYSVHAALAMAADGEGATRDQMNQVLHLPADGAKNLAAGDLGRYYSRSGRPYELAVANSLWGQKGFSWRPEFLARQKSRFGAGLEEADFVADASGARDRINGWASDKTRGKIPTILGPGDVNPLTRMVLVNAIYFKSDWQYKFNKSKTADAPFHLADGGKSPVPLMHQQAEFRYATGTDMQIVEMPYKGGDLSMVVILPTKPDGLPALEKKIAPGALEKHLAGGRIRPVRMWLPRFRIEASSSLGDTLTALGMTAAFDVKAADFSGLAGEPVSIAKVVHRAFVDVNEEGTEAAAVTGIIANAPSPVPPEPVDFRADRPFLFLIRDAKHGTILFAGRMVNPKG